MENSNYCKYCATEDGDCGCEVKKVYKPLTTTTNTTIDKEIKELAKKSYMLYNIEYNGRNAILTKNLETILQFNAIQPDVQFSNILEKYEQENNYDKFLNTFKNCILTSQKRENKMPKFEITAFGAKSTEEIDCEYAFMSMANFCSTNSITMINGTSNCGKSFFVSALLLSLQYGKEIIPGFIPNKLFSGNILYLSFENNASEVYAPVKALKNKHISSGDKENIKVFQSVMTGFKLDNENVFATLVSNIKSNNIKLCVIDTLSSSVGIENENDNAQMNNVLNMLRIILKETGCGLVLIHHIGKGKIGTGKGETSAIYAGRGASSLSAGCGCIVNIIKDEYQQSVSFSKIRTDGTFDIQRDYFYTVGNASWIECEKPTKKSTKAVELNDNDKRILNYIKSKEEVGQTEIKTEVLDEHKKPIAKTTAQNSLKKLIDAKLIVSKSEGNGKPTFYKAI